MRRIRKFRLKKVMQLAWFHEIKPKKEEVGEIAPPKNK
jgi:hypothetical protein